MVSIEPHKFLSQRYFNSLSSSHFIGVLRVRACFAYPDECTYGSHEGRCVVCGNAGTTDAYYCRECVNGEFVSRLEWPK